MANGLSAPSILNPFVVWEDAFDMEELRAFARHADEQPHHDGTVDVGDERYDEDTRVTKVSWIERTAETARFYDRIQETILYLNSQFFQYDLTKLAPLQHVVYQASEQGHLEWHIDYAKESAQNDFRKLSLSIQLSDPSEYEGGELQAQTRGKIAVAPNRFGTVIAFPSFILHRVTPVTAGVRKAVVIWVLGPDFR